MAALGLALVVIGFVRIYTADDEHMLSAFTGVYAIGIGGVTAVLGLWLG
jgi:hypothetical protein